MHQNCYVLIPPSLPFCGPVTAKMKQQDEQSHRQDLSDLATAPLPPISLNSQGAWQQLAEEQEAAISKQANIARRSPAERKQALLIRKNRKQTNPSPSL